MDINQFIYFVEVCNTGSITKAAEKLHLSQQGLSASIRRLEGELNCDLFYRKAGGIVLTDMGQLVKRESEALLRHVDRMKEFCSGTVPGVFRMNLAITEGLIVHLPANLQSFLLKGTDIFQIKMLEAYSDDCCNMVLNDECTFGIVYGDPDPKKFDVTTLDVVNQVFIVNRNHPFASHDDISINELSGIPIIITRPGSYPRNTLEKMFRDAGADFRVAYECDRPHQVIDIISNNDSLIARTVEDAITDRDLEKIKILPLRGDPYLMPIRLITKRGHTLTGYDRMFRHQIIDSYSQ